MTYGGTAQTYCLWKRDGQPFKENNVFYVNVLHPITKVSKKVRWYSDKKHHDLMPCNQVAEVPLYTLFGFKSADDTIVAIKESYLTPAEIEKDFAFKWRGGVFYDGIWYAPKDTVLPKIKNSTKFFYPTWPEFKAEGQKRIGQNTCWSKEG